MPEALGHILPGTAAYDNVPGFLGVVVDAMASTSADMHPAVLLHEPNRFPYFMNHTPVLAGIVGSERATAQQARVTLERDTARERQAETGCGASTST